jgi:hypothetical protein
MSSLAASIFATTAACLSDSTLYDATSFTSLAPGGERRARQVR